MQILDSQFNEPTLSRLGEEACRLLFTRNFTGLADKFGYLMAYNHQPAAAIEKDFERCLSGRKASHSDLGYNIESVTVTKFNPNDAGLLAVVACVALLENDTKVFVELIVKMNDEGMNLNLEEVSTPV
jgi:hypothetical protein